MCLTLQYAKKVPLIQYLVLFYKEKFVANEEVTRWFRLNNYHQMQRTGKKKIENVVKLRNSLDPPSSGVTLVGSGFPSVWLKYCRWLNVKHRLVIELGRSTKNGWCFDEQEEVKNSGHITEDQLKEVCASLNNQKVEFYDRFWGEKFREAPRLAFINSLTVQAYQPPYVSLDLSCSGGLRMVNLAYKLSELLDCPISLLEADQYEVEGYTREDCLTKTDIYLPYILKSRNKHHENLLNLLKEHQHREELFGPTHKRYLLYA